MSATLTRTEFAARTLDRMPPVKTMINRAVKNGDTPEQAQKALTRIIKEHEGYNLAYALHYEGFISLRMSERMVGA